MTFSIHSHQNAEVDVSHAHYVLQELAREVLYQLLEHLD